MTDLLSIIEGMPRPKRRTRCQFCGVKADYVTTSSNLTLCGWHLVIYYLGIHYTGA